MRANEAEETLVEMEVTYVLETDGEIVVVEGVPARVSPETGERFFAPETVERLQEIVWSKSPPSRVIEAPVYEFTSNAA